MTGNNDLKELLPDIANQWDYEMNKHLERPLPSQYSCNSNQRIHWKCEKGHTWITTIAHRTSGQECNKCQREYKISFNETVVGYYLTKILKDDYEVILTYRPSFLDRSEIDIYIPDLSLGIEYDGRIYHESREMNDCEKNNICKSKNIQIIRVREEGLSDIDGSLNVFVDPTDRNKLKTAVSFIIDYINDTTDSHYSVDFDLKRDYNDIVVMKYTSKKKRSLANKRKDLVLDWSDKNPLSPEYYYENSNDKVWWECHICGYEWEAAIYSRTAEGTGCPSCSGTVVSDKNRLAIKRPKLEKEWSKNNKKSFFDVSYGSNEEVIWDCSKCGFSFKKSIKVRVREKISCPYCTNRKLAKGYNDLQTKCSEIAKQWHKTKNNGKQPSDVVWSSSKKAWWFCEKCGNEWEQRIDFRTRNNAGCKKCYYNRGS